MTATVNTYLEAVRGQFDEGDFPGAAALCREALGAFPDEGALWQLLGLACWELGRAEEATGALEAASCLVPLGPPAQCALAEAYAGAGRHELALVVWTHLADRADCPAGLLPRVARGLGRAGDNRRALGACERLAALHPGHHGAWFGIAFYRSLLGATTAETLPHVARAHRLGAGVLSYRVSLASLLAALGRLGEAYGVARDVEPGDVHCPACVRRLLAVFGHAGDAEREAAWSAQLALLARENPEPGCC